MLKNRTIICYLYTKYDHESSFKNFIYNYKKYKSGLDHDLLICFKLLNKQTINNLSKNLVNIRYIEFIDSSNYNDFDFGSYKRVAEKFPENNILFLNSHSYPISPDWLKKLMFYKNNNNIIATSGSYESLSDSIKLKKFYKIFSYLLRKIKLKNSFRSFPNPHLRTSSFLIQGKIYYEFIKNQKINNKFDTWNIESGKNGLSSFFRNKGFDLLVINSDGKKFVENQWFLSETYNYLNQSKTIISDKHTRKYLKLNSSDQKATQFKTWGL